MAKGYECKECGDSLTKEDYLQGNGYCYECSLESLRSFDDRREEIPE